MVFGRCGRVVLFGLALLAAPPAPAREKPAPPKPAPFTLTVTGDITPELAPVVGRLTTVFYETYPALVERFENPKKPAPRHVRLVLKSGLKVPAYCSGSDITVSVEWVQKHPDDVGLLTHELTHAVQAYPVSDPSWLTEGLADYARHVHGPKKQPGWELPPRLSVKQSYKDSYRVTARFLLWLDARHPGTVDKLHRRMQDREFAPSDFGTITGCTVDELWAECVRDLGKKP